MELTEESWEGRCIQTETPIISVDSLCSQSNKEMAKRLLLSAEPGKYRTWELAGKEQLGVFQYKIHKPAHSQIWPVSRGALTSMTQNLWLPLSYNGARS